MSTVNSKSTKSAILAAYQDAIRELELAKRQLAETITEKGILLNQLASQEPEIPQHFRESYAALVDERNQLIAENQALVEARIEVGSELIAAKAQIVKQGQVIAAQPSSAPRNPKPAPKPLPTPAAVNESPVIQITDVDKVFYAKFKALPREQRLAIIDFARPQFGHIGVDNIIAVRQAWHESKQAA